MKNSEIIGFIENFAPKELACEWDRVGIMVGSGERNTEKVLFCMDYTEEVLKEAVEKGAGLVITHHPLIWDPIANVTDDSLFGKLICDTIRNDITVYSAHTNLDAAVGGVNDCMLSKCGAKLQGELKPGLNRFGTVEKISFGDFFEKVKKAFNAPDARAVIPENKTKESKISNIAVSSGAFGNDLSWLKEYNAEVVVTGEIKHNVAIDIKRNGYFAIALGHFESEHPCIEKIAKIVSGKFSIETIVTDKCNPYTYID